MISVLQSTVERIFLMYNTVAWFAQHSIGYISENGSIGENWVLEEDQFIRQHTYGSIIQSIRMLFQFEVERRGRRENNKDKCRVIPFTTSLLKIDSTPCLPEDEDKYQCSS